MLIIWGTIAVLTAGLIVWLVASSYGQPAVETAGERPSATQAERTPAPDADPGTPTPWPTQVIIIATRHPGTEVPVPQTNTPLPVPPLDQSFVAAGYDPLTGLKAADPALLNRRPVAVKVSNAPRALRAYQSGLTLADVVYEYYIEDQLTRFIAVFYGKDASKAGPVRSGRYFDEHVMRMYRSSLVFASADLRVRNYLINSPDLLPLLFLQRGDNCPPLCVDNTVPISASDGYNNLFVDTAGVGKFLTDNSKQDLRPSFFYGAVGAYSSERITDIYTHYSPRSYDYWEFNPLQQKYLRYTDSADALGGQDTEVYTPHIDHLTGQQLAADNVVEILVPHNFKTPFDRADQLFDIQLFGTGPAYVFSKGYAYIGTWIRDQLDQPIKLMGNNNLPIRLQPGETYYEVIDPESMIAQSGTRVDFTFYIPPRVLTPTPTPTRFRPTPAKHNH